MSITLDRLEKLEAAGTLTPDLRAELGRMRRERDLERQLAEAEELAKKPTKKPPVVLPEEPAAADDVLIVMVNRYAMHTDVVATVDGCDHRLNHRATCFIPRKIWKAELFNRRFARQLDGMLIVHEDWSTRLFDPRRLVSSGRAAEQEAQHLIDNVRSPLVALLWRSSLAADGQRTRKLDDLLAREGIIRPAPLTGDDAWKVIQAKRAADEKAKADAIEKRRQQDERQRKHIEAGIREETARIAAKRAAQAAYQKALADIENERTAQPKTKKRKSA